MPTHTGNLTRQAHWPTYTPSYILTHHSILDPSSLRFLKNFWKFYTMPHSHSFFIRIFSFVSGASFHRSYKERAKERCPLLHVFDKKPVYWTLQSQTFKKLRKALFLYRKEQGGKFSLNLTRSRKNLPKLRNSTETFRLFKWKISRNWNSNLNPKFQCY